AVGATARSPRCSFWRVPDPGSAREVRAFKSATSAGTSGEPPIETCGTTTGCASSRGEPAFGQRTHWGRSGEPATELYADRRCCQHGAGIQPDVCRWHRLLGLAGGVTEPIFDGGTLLHRERAAKAAYVQASEQYRSTVVTAFQDVADTLNALQQDADGLKTAADAKNAASVT